MNLTERSMGIDSWNLPPLNYRHLLALSDDTGILQHATYSIPNREHGYCVYDNARALIVACHGLRLGEGPELERLVAIYLSFLLHAFNRDAGRFRNFMSYGREWLEVVGSEDAHGRALWSLGVASGEAPALPQRILAGKLFEEGGPAVAEFTSPRALAFTVLGLDAFLDHHPGAGWGIGLLGMLAERIDEAFARNSTPDWPWGEEILCYSNAVLPLALLIAGDRLEQEEMKERGLRSLAWLLEQQTTPQGTISIIGNNGWMRHGEPRARFDQQPLDAAGLMLAAARAWIITGESFWLGKCQAAFQWFLGENDLGLPLYDAATGGCCDGLQPYGVNANQGAESTLVWLIARLAAEELMQEGTYLPLRRTMGN